MKLIDRETVVEKVADKAFPEGYYFFPPGHPMVKHIEEVARTRKYCNEFRAWANEGATS